MDKSINEHSIGQIILAGDYNDILSKIDAKKSYQSKKFDKPVHNLKSMIKSHKLIDIAGTCGHSPRFLCRSTTIYILLLSLNVRALSIMKTADFSPHLNCSTFPRFVAIRFYFLSKTLIYIASPVTFLFIHNHLTLREWCYTRLQHVFSLHPMIWSFHCHFFNVISRY